MKINMASYKPTNKGIQSSHKLGDVVTCDVYPGTPYMVIDGDSSTKALLNLETGGHASSGWVEGQVWHVRDAELTVK